MMKITTLAVLAFTALTSSAFAKDKITLCTGKTDGGYHIVGIAVQEAARLHDLDVVLVTDTGGSWKNILRGVATEATAPDSCDAFISQTSGILKLQREARSKLMNISYAGRAVTEVLHPICRKDSGVKNFDELYKNAKATVAVGDADSGNALTVSDYLNSNPEYRDKIKVVNVGANALLDGTISCAMIVGAAGDPQVSSFEQNNYKEVLFADVDNANLKSAVNPLNNQKIYRRVNIDKKSGVYNNLLSHNWSEGYTMVTDSGIYVVRSKVSPNVEARFSKAVAAAQDRIDDKLVPSWLRSR